jgi:hypothetical protein
MPQYRRRVGAVRPSHLMFTSGVGALVDLPNFSVLVSGLDDWDYSQIAEWEKIAEPRLLAAVRRLLRNDVDHLRPAPRINDDDSDPDGLGQRIGVPTKPFPGFLRCTACNVLAPVESGDFGFENDKPRRPQDARFFHKDCTRKRSGRRPLAVPARFMLACTKGHLDDFPYLQFVHRGAPCPTGASHPKLRMEDRGGNLGANVSIQCVSCRERRNIREAMGKRGEQHLPYCRGRRAHLADFEPGGCQKKPKLIVVGASNQWFAQVLTALAVPKTSASELETKIEQHWDSLFGIPGVEMLPFLRGVIPQLREFTRWSDAELWAGLEAHRRSTTNPQDIQPEQPDLLTPEWEVFSSATLPDATDDFTARRHPHGLPAELRPYYGDVVLVERLREVRALVGFTRLDAPDPDDPDLVARAPLTRGETSWVPASEVRGEGLFLRVPDDVLTAWVNRVRGTAQMAAHRQAYQRFRRNRYSDRITGAFDDMRNWPGERYLALHTLSHLLIRTIAAECGYSSASLAERIYAGSDDDPRSGILIYTAVPDAEGTLGGLVSLGEPTELSRITRRALREARHCSSDPLCAERLPHQPEDFLHGAACHVCLFVSETTCERGNRFLDRRFVVPLNGQPHLALYQDQG